MMMAATATAAAAELKMVGEEVTAKAGDVVDEDADSRDSGISGCNGELVEAPVTDFSKLDSTRHALSDCSNFVAKVGYNTSMTSSSRNSSLYHCDTPTGRKPKSVFNADSLLDHSQYENKPDRKRCSASMSPSLMSTNKRSRNTPLVGPQSDKACRYGSFSLLDTPQQLPFEEDEVFVSSTSPTTFAMPTLPRSTTSCWELEKTAEKDQSPNGSFQERNRLIRAMSVGVTASEHEHLPSVLEVSYSLPSVERPQKASQAYRSISAITLLREFARLGDQFSATYVIIDCRYPYEFIGGHVRGAINLFKTEGIKAMFFPDEDQKKGVETMDRRIPIFYCEYSQKRGPAMANAVRSIDRVRNELRYPHVEYPEMYLLDHGYKSLWNRRECRQICEPCDYVPMDHKKFTQQFKMARLERHQSKSSVKPNGETDPSEQRQGMRTRSSVRHNTSAISLHSKFSQSSNSLSTTASELLTTRGFGDEVFYLESEPKKSISAFDIQSIGSETNIDCSLIHRRRSTLSTASLMLPSSEGPVVQLPLHVTTPEFAFSNETTSPLASNANYLPLGLEDHQPEQQRTPRAVLNFSELSDTE